MKRVLFSLATFIVALTISQPVSALEMDADGVYQIGTAQDLMDFAALVNDTGGGVDNSTTSAVLLDDIDLTAQTWTPIGCDDRSYKGIFDGQFHRIKNMVINTTVKEQGFFGVAGSATIKNLIIDKSCSVSVTGGAGCAAAFVGRCIGSGVLTFENCGNEAKVYGEAANNAAFVGCNYSSGALTIRIKNCYNTGTIEGGWENGVFSGWFASAGEVTNSFNLGRITQAQDDQSLGRGIDDGKFVNTWDLNEENMRKECCKLADFAAEWLADGHLCYVLNGDQSEISWHQTIGEDAMPTFDPAHKDVYAIGEVHCNGELKGDITGFSNDPAATKRDEHNFVDGVCDYCGLVDESYLTSVDGVYQIENAKQLKWFSAYAAQTPDACAVLTADIDMTGVSNWQPIGPDVDGKYYAGTFDGQLHRIKNLNINSTEKYRGVFGVAAGATIKNLIIDSSCYFTGGQYTAALLAAAKGTGTLTIENVGNEAEVLGTDQNNSAFLASNLSSGNVKVVMKNCYNTGKVSGGKENGIFSGWFASAGTVSGCWNTGYLSEGDVNNSLGRGIATAAFSNTYDLTDNLYSEGNAKVFVLADFANDWMTNGRFCHLLNGDQNKIGWYQNIGEDATPVFDPTHKQVYVESDLNCDGTPKDLNSKYTNTEYKVNRDEHEYEDGVCIHCGKSQEGFMEQDEEGYYLIETPAQFLWFGSQANIDGSVMGKLLADMDMSGIAWNPIAKFNGTIDGQMHKISNLVIEKAENNVGLIALGTDGAVIKNIIMDETCSVTGASYVAAFIGSSDGSGTITFENVGNEANITGTGANVAGIVGVSMGSSMFFQMDNCYNTGDITGRNESAALTGWAGNASAFNNCYNTGVVVGADGSNTLYRGTSTLTNCYNIDGDQATGFTEDMLYSGELAFLLNGRVSGGNRYYQNLSEDRHPIPFSDHGRIYLSNPECYTNIAENSYDFEVDGIYYKVSSALDNTCGVTSSPSSSYTGSISIPTTVSYGSEVYSVTNIGNSAFSCCSNLTSVAIPESVTSIGGYAFFDCSSLTNITIPNSVTSIGNAAFGHCSSLTSVAIPESVTIIDPRAFEGCSSLTNVTIPESVTSIGSGAFKGCSGLANITIPESVTSIGHDAFFDCISLTSVAIPESVTIIEPRAFEGCSSLTNVTIPESVTSIGSGAFKGCSGLANITIPESVTSIGSRAFIDCGHLGLVVNYSSLDIQSGSTDNGFVAYYASWVAKGQDGDTYGEDNDFLFYETEGKKYIYAYVGTSSDVILPSGSEFVPSLFVGSKNLVSVTLPSDMTSVPSSFLKGCTSLRSVVVPESVTSIGSDAFRDCSALTSVTMPESVTSIGSYAFAYCHNLTNVTIPASVTIIDERTFYYCGSLTSVTIPDGVTSIGHDAFFHCSSLTNITIPNSVTSIGYAAFGDCFSLTSVTIPESVTSIDKYAFCDCFSLTSVTIPQSVTSIGDYAFKYCKNLTSVTIPESVTSIGMDAYVGTPWYNSQEDGFLYLDDWLLGYKGSKPEGVLIVKDGTRGIADRAFYGCTGLTSVTIPESVTSIEVETFRGCSSLTNVTIPYSVTSIGSNAFCDCSSLTSVTIPESVTSIEEETFRGCSSLTDVMIPYSVTSIGSNAFYDCYSLTNVTIPESVTSIGSDAYVNTHWYNDQEDGFLYLDDWLLGYKGPEPKGTLIVKDGTRGIADGAFFGCSSLTSVTIPDGVTSIVDYAFYDCYSLTEVTMESYIPCMLGHRVLYPASNEGFKIIVPYGASAAYRSADGWSEYADKIVELSPEDIADNLLYMENSKMFHQSQLTIPVLMKNAKPFTAFQCDITLPEGLTLHKTMNEDDEEVFDIAYGSRAKSSHSLMANQLTNGNVRVAGYSSSNADYRDSEGMLFTLTVDVADDASGELPIKLSTVILTSATDGDTNCPDMQAVLTIIPGQPGDVNGDGKLTMGDVVKLVNHILEVSQTGFNADLADVNEDGKVTMGDVVIVLNMILSGDYPARSPSMRQPTVKGEENNDLVL